MIKSVFTLAERVSDGISAGVDRHWRYTKDLIVIKPEYLLTVSVADEITKGFSNHHGIDIEIKLEEPTQLIIGNLLIEALGMKDYFKTERPVIDRDGKVDIFLETVQGRHIVEIKNFDTSATEFKKEVIRLQQLLAVNNWQNPLLSCHVAFPTMRASEDWINKHLETVLMFEDVNVKPVTKYIETGEEPGDGIPAFYVNVVTLEKKNA